MDNKLKIAAIAGSLRKASVNRALLRAAIELAPDNMEVKEIDISNIPLYNQDDDGENTSEPVKELRRKISESDGLLIATPEYNYSMPGVLKNTLDWASRPMPVSSLTKRPLGIIGATGGLSGTIRAQLHLRQVALFNNMMDMKKPEILVQKAIEKFDAEGKLTDETTRAHLKKFMIAFGEWISFCKK